MSNIDHVTLVKGVHVKTITNHKVVKRLLNEGWKTRTSEAAGEKTAPTTTPTVTGIKAAPIARSLAAEHGVDLATLAGSGINGTITKADVEAAIAAKTKE